MLGKENRKENGHRRYSLLLLALLFIGFATYGTYAYFSTSTSTQNGHLTLNGVSQDYKVDDGNSNDKSGDGTTNIETDNKYEYNPDPDGDKQQGDGKGQFVEVVDKDDTPQQDESHNSTQFGEFDWVYIGNASGVTIAKSEDLLTATQNLRAFNKYITSSKEDKGVIFNNVVGEDVFRKTVRLKVGGTATVPVKTTLEWAADVKDVKDAGLDKVVAGVFVKRGDVNKETRMPEKEFSTKEYTAAITEVTSPTEYTNENISVKPGQYLDIEIVVMVRKDIAPKDAENLNLAKIARQLSVRLDQNISSKDNTSVLGSR